MTADDKTKPRFQSKHRNGNTFIPFELAPQIYGPMTFAELVSDIFERLGEFTRKRRDYYDAKRATSTRWVFGSRIFLAVAGALAFLLTAAAAALQLDPGFAPWSRIALILALVIYAVMGAIAFYERATDRASAYFRYVIAILSMRDLWTKLEFEMLKELEKVRKATDVQAAEAAARDQIFALAEAYCNDLDKITTAEATEWNKEFQTSGGELDEAAKKGIEDVTKRIEDHVKTAQAAAAEAKAAVDALRPGQINLTIKGNFDGEVTVLLDGAEAARSVGKTIALDNVRVGTHRIATRALAAGKQLESARMVDVKAGIQSVELSLD
ncbi:hypothetical protein [Mesorhizobium sp. WSM3860]|uniref:hypothetical protein n=1 Tax=Mesorhizobium sp. WSM3860 TaxID=2029403 RepID=UPI000BAED8BB|nr:hypothetical protein [Mesorhizobium sp. WSM3860]PBC01430.1 hypothetical protein CK220_25825 [Mesorhizobium sp. WSM3860]